MAGRKRKDTKIADNPNMERALLASEAKEKIARDKERQEKLALAKQKAIEAGNDPDEITEADIDSDFIVHEYKALQDMRAVYQKLGGRKELERQMKKDPKAFGAMVKELIKIETALKKAELEGKGKGSGQGGGRVVYVIIKGLYEGEGKTQEATELTSVSGEPSPQPIDFSSMQSVLNPSQDPKKEMYEKPEELKEGGDW